MKILSTAVLALVPIFAVTACENNPSTNRASKPQSLSGEDLEANEDEEDEAEEATPKARKKPAPANEDEEENEDGE